MTHIMIDLETWGKRPGCDIRSIGATFFDPLTGHVCEFGSAGAFYIATDNPFVASYDPHMAPPINVDTGDQYNFDQIDAWRKYPLTRDPETVEWWSNPDRFEAANAFTNPVDLREALITFAVWLSQLSGTLYDRCGIVNDPVDNVRIWAHGPQFDVSILAATYEAVGLPIPWHYRAPRDTRTIMEAAGMDPHKGLEQFSTGTHHHALDDAICQAGAVCEAYRLLRTTSQDELQEAIKRISADAAASRARWLQIIANGGATVNGVFIEPDEAQIAIGVLDWIGPRLSAVNKLTR
jgi:hypothetical protein